MKMLSVRRNSSPVQVVKGLQLALEYLKLAVVLFFWFHDNCC